MSRLKFPWRGEETFCTLRALGIELHLPDQSRPFRTNPNQSEPQVKFAAIPSTLPLHFDVRPGCLQTPAGWPVYRNERTPMFSVFRRRGACNGHAARPSALNDALRNENAHRAAPPKNKRKGTKNDLSYQQATPPGFMLFRILSTFKLF